MIAVVMSMTVIVAAESQNHAAIVYAAASKSTKSLFAGIKVFKSSIPRLAVHTKARVPTAESEDPTTSPRSLMDKARL
jgi:hypothetical protein